MKPFFSLTLIFCLIPVFAQTGDIKFYNLEKEYAKTLTYVYKVQNAEALELKLILSGMLSIFGSLYVNEETNEIYVTDVEEKIADLKTIVPGLDVKELKAGSNLLSRVFYLKHESAADVSPIIRHKLSQDGFLFEVLNLNALVITDISSKIDEVLELIGQIDVPSPHISIEITIVEFNNEHFSKLGVNVFNWLQDLGVGGELRSGGPGKYTTDVMINNPTASNPRFFEPSNKRFTVNGKVNVSDLAAFISENADGTILAHSTIVTRNNKEATLSSREIIPWRAEASEESYLISGAAASLTGTFVRVKPTVQQDSVISLEILPSISNLTGWSPKGYPVVFERTLNTSIKVKNNAVFAMGGLKKKESIEVRRGLPLLKDIPLIQYFFSIKQKVVKERDVLIFIKPSLDIDAPSAQKKLDKALKDQKDTK